MTTQITVYLDPTTLPVRTQDQQTFDNNWASVLANLPTFGSQANALATEANANAVAASNGASAAATSASTASAAATTVQQTAGASMWVSGTTYAVGDNRISPSNFRTYRRKVAGAGTTDPSSDTANWILVVSTPTPTAANTQTSATGVTLTSTSAGLQTIAMTALGQSVTLPSALTMASLGGPLFVIRNSGSYPFGIRDNAGMLLMAVAPGGTAYLSLEAAATAAGTWGISGSGLEPGLITLDQTLSTTYLGTVFAPFVALDANTSLHFAALSSGFAAFIVDNTGKAIGTPVTVSAAASNVPVAAFKISPTQAIVFFSTGVNTSHSAVVLTMTGTAIAVGTVATLNVTTNLAGWDGEDSKGTPKIAQLTGTLYVACFQAYGSGPGYTAVVAISVSGSTITIGTNPQIEASSPSSGFGCQAVYALTASAALVIYANSGSITRAAVVSVAGTVCTPGAPVASGLSGFTANIISCLLSATKAVIATVNNASSGSAQAQAITITGTAVAFGAVLTMDATTTINDFTYNANGATRYNPHLYPTGPNSALLWYDQSGAPSASITCVITESGGTLTKGATLFGSFCSAASGNSGYGAVAAQNVTDFLAITQHGAANAWRKIAVPHKINGTAITYGEGQPLSELSQATTADAVPTTRLSQGDYLLFAPNTSALPVLRSNGDAIARRGTVSLPNLSGPSAYPLAAVSSNRLLLAAQTAGSAASATVQQLRLLNLEVAA